MSGIIPSESRNPKTLDLDTFDTEAILKIINQEDQNVPTAVEAAIPELKLLVDVAVHNVNKGAKIHYFGSGSSGRYALIDAVEIRPAFGLEETIIPHNVGGSAGLIKSPVNGEDSEYDGRSDAEEIKPNDIVIGCSASGSTPYIAGALKEARELGAVTALLTTTPENRLEHLSDYSIVIDVGPEIIAGASNLKAATAQKLALHMFSTCLMVKLGRVYSNLMVYVNPSNAKLRERAINILQECTGQDKLECQSALNDANDLPTALLVMLSGLPLSDEAVKEAKRTLKQTNGHIRKALSLLTTH